MEINFKSVKQGKTQYTVRWMARIGVKGESMRHWGTVICASFLSSATYCGRTRKKARIFNRQVARKMRVLVGLRIRKSTRARIKQGGQSGHNNIPQKEHFE
jgi:hypothetical protein